MGLFRKVFAIAVVAFMFSLLSPGRSVACEEVSPMSLKQLYQNSSVIVLAKPVSISEWGKIEDSEMHSRAIILRVEKSFKGSPESEISISEFKYFPLEEGEDEVASPKVDDSPGKWADSEKSLLLFLKRHESNRGLVEIEANRSAPYFSTPDQQADSEINGRNLEFYIAQLSELKEIYADSKNFNRRITEWLVKRAEAPGMRWEGSEELADSIYNLSYEASLQNISPAEKEERIAGYLEMGGDPLFAKNLDAGQKQRLIKAFLAAPFDFATNITPHEGGADEETTYEGEESAGRESKLVLSRGDLSLFRLIAKFGDSRPILKVINKLPQIMEANPDMAQSLLYIISNSIGDPEFATIYENYSLISFQSAEDFIPEADLAYDSATPLQVKAYGNSFRQSLNSQPEENGEATTDEIEGANLNEINDNIPGFPAKSYGQRRQELIHKLMMRANLLYSRKSAG